MWPFKPKTNPAIVEVNTSKYVKIRVDKNEERAIEDVIISSDKTVPLTFRYCEYDHCIYLYRE